MEINKKETYRKCNKTFVKLNGSGNRVPPSRSCPRRSLRNLLCLLLVFVVVVFAASAELDGSKSRRITTRDRQPIWGSNQRVPTVKCPRQ